MGAEKSKQAPPDMNTIIFKLKMSSKRFIRESHKAVKEKEKNIKSAKACLVKGNEEGARLYASNAQTNENESKKYLAMGTRLDAISGQLKSNHSFQDVMKHISKDVIPMLMNEAESLDIKEMVMGFENFQDAFDKMQVNTGIMGKTFDKMQEANTVQNTENLLAQLKNEVNYEIAKESGEATNQQIPLGNNKKTLDDENLDNFINDLRK